MAARQAGMSFAVSGNEFWSWRTDMSQAALNTRNSDEETPSSRRNNNASCEFILLTVLRTVFVSGCGS